MKYLLVLLVVGVGVWVWSARFRAGPRKGRKGQGGSDVSSSSPAAKHGARTMVACGHCGVHLPADEAVYADQQPYCGPAHLQAGLRR